MARQIGHRFREQVQRNSVALISVFIAVVSLSYNTWRNELTEYNRNQRSASIEILLKLGELQELVFLNHYDRNETIAGNPRTGWALVLTIDDLAQVLEEPLPDSSRRLHSVWAAHWDELGRKDESAEQILGSIDVIRRDTKTLLTNLD